MVWRRTINSTTSTNRLSRGFSAKAIAFLFSALCAFVLYGSEKTNEVIPVFTSNGHTYTNARIAAVTSSNATILFEGSATIKLQDLPEPFRSKYYKLQKAKVGQVPDGAEALTQAEVIHKSDLAKLLSLRQRRDEMYKWTVYGYYPIWLTTHVGASVYVHDNGAVSSSVEFIYIDKPIFMKSARIFDKTNGVTELSFGKPIRFDQNDGTVKEVGCIEIADNPSMVNRLTAAGNVRIQFDGTQGHFDRDLTEREKLSIKAAVLLTKYFKGQLSDVDNDDLHALAAALP